MWWISASSIDNATSSPVPHYSTSLGSRRRVHGNTFLFPAVSQYSVYTVNLCGVLKSGTRLSDGDEDMSEAISLSQRCGRVTYPLHALCRRFIVFGNGLSRNCSDSVRSEGGVQRGEYPSLAGGLGALPPVSKRRAGGDQEHLPCRDYASGDDTTKSCMLVVVPNSDFAEVEWGAADRPTLGNQRPVVQRGSPHHPQTEPEQLPGPNEPASRKEGPVLHTEQLHLVGLQCHPHLEDGTSTVNFGPLVHPGWASLDPDGEAGFGA